MRLFILSTPGRRVAELRREKNLSQKDLAEMVKTTQQTIANIESKSPQSRYYFSISEVLDVPYEWIMKGEKNHPAPTSGNGDEYYIRVSEEAFEQAVTSFKALSLQRGDDVAGVDFSLLKSAFKIAVRGKITGDYVTASLTAQSLKKKA
jgi:transcriptional regulator with XRE-family HTH domain